MISGPLVNVILLPVLWGLYFFGKRHGWADAAPDAFLLLVNVAVINTVILVFNLLPVYPLDGGQILRALLWFPFGRANSLMAASVIGIIGVVGFILFAIYAGSVWLGIMAAFILLNCWGGLMQARALAKVAKIPRRAGFACPSCHTAPPLGPLWRCGQCKTPFDTFATGAACPHCGAQFDLTQCLDCGLRFPMNQWRAPAEGEVRSSE